MNIMLGDEIQDKTYIIKIESMTTRKDVMNEFYTGVLITAGTMGVSFASRKLAKDTLGIPMTLNGAVKLAVAIGLSAVGVKYAEDKDWIPKEISKD